MTRRSLLTVALLTPPIVLAKGETIRITISGGDLIAPIEIDDPKVALFHVWAGPGTSSNEAQSLIADWTKPTEKPPEMASWYEVSIHTTRRNPGTYIVLYALHSSTNEGFVYIPGRDHKAYTHNTWLIARGVEGRWFRAWSEWQKLAQPLISEAKKAHGEGKASPSKVA